MNLAEDFVSTGERFSKHARKARGIINMKKFCDLFNKLPDDINWTIEKTEFDELLALKEDSAPGPEGIPYSV